jgi:hypothetical protein
MSFAPALVQLPDAAAAADEAFLLLLPKTSAWGQVIPKPRHSASLALPSCSFWNGKLTIGTPWKAASAKLCSPAEETKALHSMSILTQKHLHIFTEQHMVENPHR